ncbi:piggyBac transposable element-derived protein 4-like [Ranitomeya imitator]|uniref:piggyBac transposable element-derived protein 4-like n=1 Tax=Ranitomeya imitator TaxID=111125 RepID=UPI0037E825C5
MAQSTSRGLTVQEIEAIIFNSDEDNDISLSDEEYIPPANVSTTSSSDSSDDEEVMDPAECASRTTKTNVFWNSTAVAHARTPSHNIIRVPQGAVGISQFMSKKDVFSKFVSDDIADEVVLCTNVEGKRIASEKKKTWKNLTKEELYAYIGLTLLAGSTKSYDVPIRELFLNPFADPHYKATMSVDRFEAIRRCIRFDEKRTRPVRLATDKLAPISNIWNLFIKNCYKLYNSSEYVTVDEQLLAFRGPCKFIQYMPSKPAKYGIKIFWMCDSATYYGMNGMIYCGKEADAPVQKDHSNIVKTLALPIFHSGKNITMDNYFTNLELANFLLQKQLTLVGTMRPNRREIPPIMKHNAQRPIYESVFGFCNEATMVSYKAKKEKSVILLSTMHHDESIDTNDRKQKPEIILHYNKTKRGVDKMDEMITEYSCKRQTKRWPVALFSNILDVSSLNSYIVYCQTNPEFHANRNDKRRLFLTELCYELLMPTMLERSSTKCLSRQITEAMIRCGICFQEQPEQREKKRKRCYICPAKKERKSERFCSTCRQNVCREHSEEKIICKNCRGNM